MDQVEFHNTLLSLGGVVSLKLQSLALQENNNDEVQKQVKFAGSDSKPPKGAQDNKPEFLMTIDMGNNLPNVDPKIETTFDKVKATWTDDLTLTIIYTQLENGARYDVEWCMEGQKKKAIFRDLVSMTGGHWYGGAVTRDQRWPLAWQKRETLPFVTGDAKEDRYSGVVERYWLSTQGVALLVHSDCPLYVGTDEKKRLILESKWDTPYLDTKESGLVLKYSIFQSQNIMTVHELVSHHFPKPRDIPDIFAMKYPVWSTAAMDRKVLNQDHCQSFVKQIKDLKLPISYLQIDDDWMKTPGDLEFEPKTFKDPVKLAAALERLGVKLMLTVHPHCTAFSKASDEKGYWLSSPFVGYTGWWRGLGKLLDITNIDAVRWFLKRLVTFRKQHKVTSFRFDGGEAFWIPRWPRYKETPSDPCEYSRSYAALAAAADTKIHAQQVRIANRTQHLGIFVRTQDKSGTWNYENGLKTIIPTVLTHSILGYPFFLCDVISCAAYEPEKNPSKELYIRWLQLATFMPGIQMTHLPWSHDDETVGMAKMLFKLRAQYFEVIEEVARNSTQTGAPIIRPLWWTAPDDENTYDIDSQFLLGEDILVAPVLNMGATKIDIYLPHGRWRDVMRDETLIGGRWRKDYPVNMYDLPFFTRVKAKIHDRKSVKRQIP